jgi:hypothetical protein
MLRLEAETSSARRAVIFLNVVEMDLRIWTSWECLPGCFRSQAHLSALGNCPTQIPRSLRVWTLRLSAVSNGNMFRDMRGLAATIDLAKTAMGSASSEASGAATQAGTNMATAAKTFTDTLQAVLPLIAAAAGIPLPAGVGSKNISNAGAMLNKGAQLDQQKKGGVNHGGSRQHHDGRSVKQHRNSTRYSLAPANDRVSVSARLKPRRAPGKAAKNRRENESEKSIDRIGDTCSRSCRSA